MISGFFEQRIQYYRKHRVVDLLFQNGLVKLKISYNFTTAKRKQKTNPLLGNNNSLLSTNLLGSTSARTGCVSLCHTSYGKISGWRHRIKPRNNSTVFIIATNTSQETQSRFETVNLPRTSRKEPLPELRRVRRRILGYRSDISLEKRINDCSCTS